MTEPQSPIRVSISDAVSFDGIDIWLGLRYTPTETKVMQFGPDGIHSFKDPEPQYTPVTPTMHLPHEFARALLDQLFRYYAGAQDLHTVRSDLLHERERVDKLVDALIESNAIQVRMRDFPATRAVIGS